MSLSRIFNKTDPREEMANQLLMRGHGTMREIMTMSYGEWPPKGLDIDPEIKLDQRIPIKRLAEDTLLISQIVDDQMWEDTKKRGPSAREKRAQDKVNTQIAEKWRGEKKKEPSLLAKIKGEIAYVANDISDGIHETTSKIKANFYARMSLALDRQGHTTLAGDKTIYINKMALRDNPLDSALSMLYRVPKNNDLAGVIGHEALHTLQGDHTRLGRSQDAFGEEGARKISEIEKQGRDIASDRLIHELATEEFRIHNPDVKFSEYYGTGIEIQARLHQVMAEGYQLWGKLPSNPQEFTAAAYSLGLIDIDTPGQSAAKIVEALDATPQFDVRLESQNPDHAKIIQRVNEIKLGIEPYSAAGKEKFYNEVLPLMYADMIEMYGDTQGRERFTTEYGENPRPEIIKEGERLRAEAANSKLPATAEPPGSKFAAKEVEKTPASVETKKPFDREKILAEVARIMAEKSAGTAGPKAQVAAQAPDTGKPSPARHNTKM